MSVLFSLVIKSSDTSDVELAQARAEHCQVEAGQGSVMRTVEGVRGSWTQHVVEIHFCDQTCAEELSRFYISVCSKLTYGL